ncbi:HAD family hydrolase [Sporomusa malonica]|uniref:FMN phosphatase YigB, HAD superfamily n=1 Tax=Sporomusa malonica TaxID=112901 RepID=A0A1W2BRJ7_9FIRM|nr:HAD family hydrolase [Sporomusa malonica]SMC75491.1 FMN phosphatase YigB, HAD superfamily [Sporomusa malonica]
MIKSVLFDLDGTLLPINQDEFLREYLKHLGARVAQVVDSKKFVSQLLASTAVMIKSRDKAKTNQQVFFEDFLPNIGVAADILMPVIDDFYERDFILVKPTTKYSAAARQAVLAVVELGLDVVIATNPIFPISAIRQRIDWAGVGDVDFKFVTSYEECRFCKPHPEYYLEIAERIGCRPEECLMVGNDVGEDLAAAKIGMKTYLVTDCLLNSKDIAVKTDYQGTLTELAETIAGIISSENQRG